MGARDEEDIKDVYHAESVLIHTQTIGRLFLWGIGASGVQFDNKVSDESFDAVWESEVKITAEGWIFKVKNRIQLFVFQRNDSKMGISN
ncbi:MAG: hypothetical protein IPL74_15085 [Bacteroidetes bacterium]|nr:hypothetical protein [Bacteroidota bacterium]